jgi:excisionase family DNA binding protein
MPDDTYRNEWFLTLDEVGSLLRVTGATVRRQILAGELPGRKIGGVWRISSEELGAYLNRVIEPGADGAPPRMITGRYPRAEQGQILEPVDASAAVGA